jgi:hypothetical protein
MPAGTPQTGLVITTNYTKGQGECEGDKKGEDLPGTHFVWKKILVIITKTIYVLLQCEVKLIYSFIKEPDSRKNAIFIS